MATDTWLGKAVLERDHPYHPAGLPNDGGGSDAYDGSEFSVDAPTYMEVLAARRPAGDGPQLPGHGHRKKSLRNPGGTRTHRRRRDRPCRACARSISREEWNTIGGPSGDLDTLANATAKAQAPGRGGRTDVQETRRTTRSLISKARTTSFQPMVEFRPASTRPQEALEEEVGLLEREVLARARVVSSAERQPARARLPWRSTVGVEQQRMAAEDQFVGVRRPSSRSMRVPCGMWMAPSAPSRLRSVVAVRRRCPATESRRMISEDPTTLGVAAADEAGPQVRAFQQVPRGDRDELARRHHPRSGIGDALDEQVAVAQALRDQPGDDVIARFARRPARRGGRGGGRSAR